jgi:hypothetical protein
MSATLYLSTVGAQQRIELSVEETFEFVLKGIAFLCLYSHPDRADDGGPRKARSGHYNTGKQIVVRAVAIVLNRIAG